MGMLTMLRMISCWVCLMMVVLAYAKAPAVDFSRPTAGLSSNSHTTATPRQQNGQLISLNFQDISVRSALQLLADFSGVNMIANDAVRGHITLRLKDVTWEQALNVILITQGLMQKNVGNVLMITPKEQMADRNKILLKRMQQLDNLSPLQDSLIHLNYAKASDIAELLKAKNNSLLSKRGSVATDTRTNTLLIQDVPDSLTAIQALVQRLDVSVRQVLIEARIVNISTSYEQALGVKWGITKPTFLSGSIEGHSQTLQDKLHGLDGSGVDDDINNRLNVNLPAATPTGVQAPSAGIALAHLGHGYLLDLELQAIEAEGGADLISSPRLITASQHAATIEQGTQIPYQESTSGGATAIAFASANLSLTVTPQITPDNHIIMDLHVTQNTVGQNVPTGNGGFAPSIDTREITTNVLVNNGDTIVLGGIYEDDSRNQTYRVPFLGEVPGLGFFFRNTQKVDDRKELLIFISPKIIMQTAMVG